jgi:hypothetical protein
MNDLPRTQGTMGLVRQARKRFGLGGALAAWCDRRRWIRVSGALTQPSIKDHDKQPHECDQYKLVETKMRQHGNAPSNQYDMGALYRVLTPLGLSAR